jgi:hypothetical protein
MIPSAHDEIRNSHLIQGDGQDAQSVRDALANSSDREFRVEATFACFGLTAQSAVKYGRSAGRQGYLVA